MKKISSGYYYNVSQLLNMTIMALLVPAVIGLANYGKFAALFAIPGLLQVFIECFYLSYFSRVNNQELIDKITATISIVATVLAFLVSCFLFDFYETICVLIILLFLINKSKWQNLLLCSNPSVYYNTLIKIEVIALGVNIPAIFFAYLFDLNFYFLPVFMVIVPMYIAKIIFKKMHVKIPQVSISDSSQELKIKREDFYSFGIRVFEELFITLSPLFISTVFGLSEAGRFRISISIAKLFFKLIPFRYDVGICDILNCRYNYALTFKFMLYIAFLPLVLVAIVYSNQDIYGQIQSKVMMGVICTSGLLSINSIFSPKVNFFYPIMILFAVLLFVLTVIVAILNRQLFEHVYFLSCLVYSGLTVYYLNAIRARYPYEKSI